MAHHAGIDVSLERSSLCVVDATGKIIREARSAAPASRRGIEPEALVGFVRRLGVPLTRIGPEAGPLSPWLHAGLAKAGFDAALLETGQVKAALSAMVVKADGVDGTHWHHRAKRRLSAFHKEPSPCRSARSASLSPSGSSRSTA